jgi:hypothetical protein
MVADHGDMPIHKGAAVGLHDAENGAQPRGVAQLRITVGEGKGLDLGHPLHHKGVQGAVLAADDGLNARADLFVINGPQAVQAEQAQSTRGVSAMSSKVASRRR